MLHTHLHLHVALIRRSNGRNLGTFQEAMLFRKSGSIGLKKKSFNPLNAELNPICHLLALLGAHHILHVSRIRVNIFRLSVGLGNASSHVTRIASKFYFRNQLSEREQIRQSGQFSSVCDNHKMPRALWKE